MITSKKLILSARQTAFVGALLVGCQSPDAARQKLVREANNSAQMPSWEATKQSEVGMPEIKPETYMAAGRLHETQGRLTRAAAQYRMAIQLKPDNVEAHNRLGLVLCQMRQFKEAEAELVRAIKLAPKQAHLYNNLGFCYLVQNRWAEAEQRFGEALERDPGFARAHINLGMVLAQQERFDEAMRHFEIIVPLEDAWFNIGLMYQSKSRSADAARAFKTALKLNPEMVAARQCLDKLPPAVSVGAEPFESVGTLAAAPRSEPLPEETSQGAEPVESLATSSQPATGEQMTPEQSIDEDMRTVDITEPDPAQPEEPASGSPELAEFPGTLESPADEPVIVEAPEPDIFPGASESSPTASPVRENESDDIRPLDPETLALVMSPGLPGISAGILERELLAPSTQPENEMVEPAEPPAMAARTEPAAPPIMSSTSQPSIALPLPGTGTEIKDLFALRRTPIDLSAPSDEGHDEIVLSVRPPMPPAARNLPRQATQPATDVPTPEQLRTVIEALLELSQAQAPKMPKPYSLPTSHPAAAAPQSRPAEDEAEVPEKLSLSVDMRLDDPEAGWHRPVWDHMDALFAPDDTFGSAGSEE